MIPALMDIILLTISFFPILAFAQGDIPSNGPGNGTAERVGWVSADNERSTADILWSCFTIFLVCSWKCIHLNIPSIEESEADWCTAKGLAILLKYWGRKLKWMCAAAMAPELTVAMAASQFVEAWKLHDKYRHLGFTMTHAFYAYMGGFVLAIPPRSKTRGSSPSDGPEGTSIKKRDSELELFHLHPENLDLLIDLDIPLATSEQSADRLLPIVKEEDLFDRSKADLFTKLFAIAQCGWLIMQSIARTAAGLPLTELELATLAFIFTAVIMYILWWHKPFDAQRPMTLVLCAKEADTTTETSLRSRLRRLDRKSRRRNLTMDNMDSFLELGEEPIWGKRAFAPDDGLRSFLFYFTGVTFSALHLIAWNWDFPSRIVRILWRTFSITATCSCLFPVFPAVVLKEESEDYPPKFVKYPLTSMGIVCLTLYPLARLGLIVLTFYCFSSMPAAIYQTVDWPSVLPHFS